MTSDARVIRRTTASITKWAFFLVAANGILIVVRAQSPGTTVPVERLAVPVQSELDAADQVVTNQFSIDSKGLKRPDDKLELAEKLLSASRNEAGPAIRFVMLRMARDLAAEAGHAPRALEAIDQLARSYRVEARLMQLETLRTVVQRTRNPQALDAVATLVLDEVPELYAADQYTVGGELASLARAAAQSARDKHLMLLAQQHSKQFGTLEHEYAAVQKFVERLRSSPSDPEASLELGKFYCFVAGDWDRGAPLLAAGSDARLKQVAEQEMLHPSNPEQQIALGELWESAGAALPPALIPAAETRCRYWYAQAAPRMSGQRKAVLLRKISRLPAAAARLRVLVENGDGKDQLTITPEQLSWKHISWTLPTSVRINDFGWDLAARDTLRNSGSTQLLPHNVNLASVNLTKLRGRGPVELTSVETTQIVVTIDDEGPGGSDQYEFLLTFTGR